MSDTPDDPGAPARASTPVQVTVSVGGERAPWWVPEARTWIVLGLFVLAWKIISLLAKTPALATNTLFVAIATTICGMGGLGAVVGYFFISAKKEAQKSASDQGPAQ